ncbi:MAG: hypothetical protein MJK04_36165, partial [Psychrosphaera sp.]|nr:hypothetical protein [Psychrosphaera sp.]
MGEFNMHSTNVGLPAARRSRDLNTEARSHGVKKEKSKVKSKIKAKFGVLYQPIFKSFESFKSSSFFPPCLRASAIAPALLYHITSMYLSVL